MRIVTLLVAVALGMAFIPSGYAAEYTETKIGPFKWTDGSGGYRGCEYSASCFTFYSDNSTEREVVYGTNSEEVDDGYECEDLAE